MKSIRNIRYNSSFLNPKTGNVGTQELAVRANSRSSNKIGRAFLKRWHNCGASLERQKLLTPGSNRSKKLGDYLHTTWKRGSRVLRLSCFRWIQYPWEFWIQFPWGFLVLVQDFEGRCPKIHLGSGPPQTLQKSAVATEGHWVEIEAYGRWLMTNQHVLRKLTFVGHKSFGRFLIIQSTNNEESLTVGYRSLIIPSTND